MASYKIDTKISQAFSCHFLGLTSGQWIISVLCGLVTFPINAVLKLAPDDFCIALGDEPEEDKVEAAKEYDELIAIAKKYHKFRDLSGSQRFV
jgi:hypothetical protein